MSGGELDQIAPAGLGAPSAAAATGTDVGAQRATGAGAQPATGVGAKPAAGGAAVGVDPLPASTAAPSTPPAPAAAPSVPARVRLQDRPLPQAGPVGRRAELPAEAVFEADEVSISYGAKPALAGVTMRIPRSRVTALIGPSGCGKSTFIRALNRMNDSIPGFRLEGALRYHGHDLYASNVDHVEVRRRIGMVFQKPNPFPKSIHDNVAWAPRNLGLRHGLEERVERALRQAALWDEVKDRLGDSALGLSGGQQQRLCIARAIAIEPDVLLLDEPASALDPISAAAIESLVHSLKGRFTIVIVTHNMQQAARVADRTAFFSLDTRAAEPVGMLVELDDTEVVFNSPADPRTRDYVSGRFG